MQEYIKKILGSGRPSSSAAWTTTLIISNDEMKDIKIVKSLKDSSLLPEGVNNSKWS